MRTSSANKRTSGNGAVALPLQAERPRRAVPEQHVDMEAHIHGQAI